MARVTALTARRLIALSRQERVHAALLRAEGDGCEALTAAEISGRTGQRQPLVVGALRRLEASGEVARDAIREDRRAALWRLTSLGRGQAG